MNSLKGSLVCLAVVLGVLGTAQTVAGDWKGKLVIDQASMSKLKKMGQATFDAAQKTIAAMKISLSLNKSKTFKISISGAPGSAAPHTMEGTWSQKGSILTLHATKQDGKPPQKNNPDQTITAAQDGKSMTMVPVGAKKGGPPPPMVVFTR